MKTWVNTLRQAYVTGTWDDGTKKTYRIWHPMFWYLLFRYSFKV